jgi:hypothetical protein
MAEIIDNEANILISPGTIDGVQFELRITKYRFR